MKYSFRFKNNAGMMVYSKQYDSREAMLSALSAHHRLINFATLRFYKHDGAFAQQG